MIGGREYRDCRFTSDGEFGSERGKELLVLALCGRGDVSEEAELRDDVAVADEVEGESGGVGKVVANSSVSMSASASKLMLGRAGDVPLAGC